MRFDTKIAIAVREDLAPWQELNVTAFLASGIAHADADIMGSPYEDAAGRVYQPLFREPVLVYAATAEQLAALHTRALTRDLRIAVYTAEMFATGNDADNRAVVLKADPDALDLVGVAVHGPRNAVDRSVKGLRLHS